MATNSSVLCLDVGTVRIGVATADMAMRIPIPHGTIDVDGTELRTLAGLIVDGDVKTIVVGYPRNQSGEATAQSAYVEAFVERIKDMAQTIVFQDESLTSVLAEERLRSRGATYQKADIDAEAAVIILEDYLEQHDER